MKTRMWVIWSEEHGGWWGRGEHGYVTTLVEAGRYTEARAREIEANANRYLRPGHVNEVAMPDPMEKEDRLERALPCRGSRRRRATANGATTMADRPLDREIETFEQQKAQLEGNHMDKFVVIKGGELIGAWDTLDAAAREAVRRFGRGPYLIRQVGAAPDAAGVGPVPRYRT